MISWEIRSVSQVDNVVITKEKYIAYCEGAALFSRRADQVRR